MKHLHTLAALALLAGSAGAANPVIEIKVSGAVTGTIKAELFEDKAPITVKNMLQYIEKKHYDGLIFHRVIPTFMIQGGGHTKGFGDITTADQYRASERKAGKEIENEATNGLKNTRGTLAMARKGDPHSASAQFFINVKDNPGLDHKNKDTPRGWGYAVFGKVIDGMKVVDEIKDVKTKSILAGAIEDVPVKEVVIESIRVVAPEKKEPAKDAKKDK